MPTSGARGRAAATFPAVGTTRLAEVADLERLRAVEREAGALFRTVGMIDVAEDEPPSTEVLAGFQREGRAWVALDHAAAAAEPATRGVVGLALALELDGNGHLEQLSVVPAWGRRGHGRRLVEEVAGWAAARGAPALTLSTFTSVPWNAPYYRRLGFVPIPPTELTPGLLAAREHERRLGLDVGARTFMRRPIG